MHSELVRKEIDIVRAPATSRRKAHHQSLTIVFCYETPATTGPALKDQVSYDSQAPWYVSADGQSDSLQRTAAESFGDSARSWTPQIPTPGSAQLSRLGDADLNGELDVHDVDQLCKSIRGGDSQMDLNGDDIASFSDLTFLVRHLMDTNFGDANLDGVFNSKDLVQIFQSGEYEDRIPDNSTWASGDWNCDGEFTSRDFVLAFRSGSYVANFIPEDPDNANL